MTAARLPLVICIAVSATLTVSPGEERAESELCAEATTTAEMQQCLSEQYESADRQLNRAYRKAMELLSEARQAKLKEAQRAWIHFRDKTAEFEASEVEGGTMYPLVYLSALISMTEERSSELEAIHSDSARR